MQEYKPDTEGFDAAFKDLMISLTAGRPVIIDTHDEPHGHTVVNSYDPTQKLIFLYGDFASETTCEAGGVEATVAYVS